MQEISRAELLRKVSAEQQQKVVAGFEKASSARPGEQLGCFIHALGLALVWGISYLPEIAARAGRSEFARQGGGDSGEEC